MAPRIKPFPRVNWGHPLSGGLTAFWLFSEGSGSKVLDIARNLYHGTIAGTAITWAMGNDGWAVQSALSAGVDAITISPALPALTRPFTVDFKLKAASFSDGYGKIISQGTSNGFYARSTSKVLYYGGADRVQDSVLSANQWYHIGFRCLDDNNAWFYLDGKLDTATPLVVGAGNPTFDGMMNDANTETFDGLMSFIRVWNGRLLTETDMWALARDPYEMLIRPRRVVPNVSAAAGYPAGYYDGLVPDAVLVG